MPVRSSPPSVRDAQVQPVVDLRTARRAGALRFAARRGSALDALVVAIAEQRGEATVLTSDPGDLSALAGHTTSVVIARA